MPGRGKESTRTTGRAPPLKFLACQLPTGSSTKPASLHALGGALFSRRHTPTRLSHLVSSLLRTSHPTFEIGKFASPIQIPHRLGFRPFTTSGHAQSCLSFLILAAHLILSHHGLSTAALHGYALFWGSGLIPLGQLYFLVANVHIIRGASSGADRGARPPAHPFSPLASPPSFPLEHDAHLSIPFSAQRRSRACSASWWWWCCCCCCCWPPLPQARTDPKITTLPRSTLTNPSASEHTDQPGYPGCQAARLPGTRDECNS